MIVVETKLTGLGLGTLLMDAALGYDGLIRLFVALLIFLLLAVMEMVKPRRIRQIPRSTRWLGNLAIQGVNGILARIIAPWMVPVWVADCSVSQGLGLFNTITLPVWLVLIVSLLMLDGIIYWQHRLLHQIPALWRLHRLHHTDVDVDVTTALRFHPLEILLSMAIKSVAVILLGVPVMGVIIFAVILNGMAMFNHANIKLSEQWDGRLRRWVVTPDMHRVHHSVEGSEHNRNFGFCLSCWDRWLGSYRARPSAGHSKMILGLGETNSQKTGSVVWMLMQPFR